jgi:regulatory protein YycI of two-component signal transduction system YycFG
MGVYEVQIDPDDLNPMSEMGNRELSTWRGLKNKSLRGRHLTDGTLLFDKKHVENEDLYQKLMERKSDKTVENNRIKELVSHLKDEKQWVGKVRGQMKRSESRGMGSVASKWIAVVGYQNYKNHCLTNAQAVQMARKLVGESADLKVGESEVLTWHKYGVPAVAIATWNFYEANVK